MSGFSGEGFIRKGYGGTAFGSPQGAPQPTKTAADNQDI
jgi:hypothetical protein